MKAKTKHLIGYIILAFLLFIIFLGYVHQYGILKSIEATGLVAFFGGLALLAVTLIYAEKDKNEK